MTALPLAGASTLPVYGVLFHTLVHDEHLPTAKGFSLTKLAHNNVS
jgi:hypothetical protein